MQTESELKKHEFRIIYIIAEKNCTIFGGGIFGETFIMWELCPLASGPVKAQGRRGGWDRLGAQQHASQQHIAGRL